MDAYINALGNNEYYEQVLRVIALLDKPDLKALPLHGEKWYEIDDIQDLSNAETIFAERRISWFAIKKDMVVIGDSLLCWIFVIWLILSFLL